MDQADTAIVYFNPSTLEHKRLAPITLDQIRDAFGRSSIRVFNDPVALSAELRRFEMPDTVMLMMSSGTFDGIKLDELG
jgi:UDP-N-acetylmuramate: L-alanyl-gamma-D-glutamyl-meso-diaminopimelate ligase